MFRSGIWDLLMRLTHAREHKAAQRSIDKVDAR